MGYLLLCEDTTNQGLQTPNEKSKCLQVDINLKITCIPTVINYCKDNENVLD